MAPDKMERVNVQLQTIENVSKIKPYGLERMIIPYAARIKTSKLEGLEMLAKKQTKERKTINLSVVFFCYVYLPNCLQLLEAN
jgi:hypothetical protein